MTLVNYGSPVVFVSGTSPFGGTFTRAEHDGPDGHDQMKFGEQCECGIINLGIVPIPESGS